MSDVCSFKTGFLFQSLPYISEIFLEKVRYNLMLIVLKEIFP